MCEPRQRGAYISTKCGSNLQEPMNPPIDHCAHCLNGGGSGSVKERLPPSGWNLYDPIRRTKRSTSRAGLCGDKFGETDHMVGGRFMPYENVPIVSVYKSGAEVDFTAEIDTNHNGFFEFYVCDLDTCGAKDLEVKCFNKGNCYKLERVPHSDCENAAVDTIYDCGPIDKKKRGRWYLPCRTRKDAGVQIVGGESGTMRYKLPDGVSCKHCVLQWYWATANRCNPRGVAAYFRRYNRPFGTTCPSDAGSGAHEPTLSTCKGMDVPEEFWSCSDIQITPDGEEDGSNEASPGPAEDLSEMI